MALAAVSQDGRPLATSHNIPISVANTSWNSGLKLDLGHIAEDTAYAAGLARSITSHGDLPVLVGRVGLDLQAEWLTGRACRMVDYNGKVLSEGVPAEPCLTIPAELPVHTTTITMTEDGHRLRR